MNLTIEHDGKQTEIQDPFKLCGSREDLQALSEQLREKLEQGGEGWAYAWIAIDARRETT